MSMTIKEIEDFRDFAIEAASNGGAELTLEECLRRWRRHRASAEPVANEETPFNKAQRLGLIGCIRGTPPDLSTNCAYLDGFGES